MKVLVYKMAAVLCAISFLPSAAGIKKADAAEWINLSSWAYSDVSGFVSAGLLPESLSDISEYMRPIKRGEFCELIYSVLYNTGIFADYTHGNWAFSDCDNYPNVNKLRMYGIINGYDDNTFRPENNITREDVAVLVEQAMEEIGIYSLEYKISDDEKRQAGEKISDYGDISDYAVNSVIRLINDGVMSDMGEGRFCPKREVTFEQGVIIAYRLYKQIPRLVDSDNDGISGETEQIIQTYENGLEQTYIGNCYYVKRAGSTLMSFEEDVYSKIYSCDYKDKSFIFAVNFNDKTDVYEADTGTFLYTIPYIVYNLEPQNGYIYVYSSRYMPAYSGVYSFEGTELLPPEYSETELKDIMENQFKIPEEEYRTADGWVYYSDWNDNGHMYKIDSNGENKKLLVGSFDCYDTMYINNMLYFNANEDKRLYCVDTDGNNIYSVSEEPGSIVWVAMLALRTDKYTENEVQEVMGQKLVYKTLSYGGGEVVFTDGAVLYGEDKEIEKTYVDGNGEESIITQNAKTLYTFRTGENGAERKQIADFPVMDVISSFSGDDRIVFTNGEEFLEKGYSPVYMYDGKELSCISGDLKASAFGFLTDNDGDTLCSNRIGFITPEEIELGTYHIVDLDTGEITQEYLKDTTGSNTDYETDNDMNIYEEFSGEGYDILRDDDGMLYVRTNDGTDALEKGSPVCRDNDYLYYTNRDGYASGTYIVSSSIVNSRRRNTLIRYNLATGEREVVNNNYVMSVGAYWDNKMLFLDGLGRYNSIDAEEVLTAYPNKGLYRYGEVESIGHAQRRIWQPRYLYKFDKDGRVTQLTDTHTEYWIYIPNYPDEEIFSY